MNDREQNQINKFIGLAESIFISYYNYRVLCDVEDRTKILTKTASDFFNFINKLLIDDFFLQVTRIMERCEFQKRKNLTVSFIVHMSIWNEEQREVLKCYQEKLKILSNKIKPARHRIIAHNDLETYENEDIDSLGGFEEGLDQDFIIMLEEFCNYIHKEAFGEIWGNFAPNTPGDVQELIGYLYRGDVFHQVKILQSVPKSRQILCSG